MGTQLPLFNDKTMLPTGKHHVSYSEIADWMECSWRHKQKHVNKIALDDGSIHTSFGKALHDAAEQYITTKVMKTKEEVIKDMYTHISELRKQASIDKATKLAKPDFEPHVEDMLAQLPPWLDEQFPGWECVSAEHMLFESITKQPNLNFKGFIDAVLKVPKKRGKGHVYWILDWKGQRLTAPILTPTGWTTMGELKIGSSVIGSDGEAIKVKGIFPLGEREVYRVYLNDGNHVDTTDDHLWKVYTPAGSGGKEVDSRFSKVLTTEQMMNGQNAKYRHLQAFTSPVEFNNNNGRLPLDSYLLGVLLGDGSFRGGIKLTSADTEILESVRKAIPLKVQLKKVGKTPYEYRLSVSQKGFNPRIQRNNNPILDEIRKFGLEQKLSHEKFVPKEYLFGSVEQRLAVVQGLLDTDGWVQKGIAKYSTTSPILAKNMRHLVGSLGGLTFESIRPLRPGANHEEHVVTVRLPKDLPPFRLQRKLLQWNSNPAHGMYRKIVKIEKLPEKAKMQCIKVDSEDSLYTTNDFILTHNTTSWGWPAKRKRDYQKQLQLILYKHFFCQLKGIDPADVRTGFVLLKRKKGDRIELVPVSVGPKATERGLKTLHGMINQVKAGFTTKNRFNCEPFCPYLNTEHCH